MEAISTSLAADIQVPATLEQSVALTCFCKLRESCLDKQSSTCMKDRNLYSEFMLAKKAQLSLP